MHRPTATDIGKVTFDVKSILDDLSSAGPWGRMMREEFDGLDVADAMATVLGAGTETEEAEPTPDPRPRSRVKRRLRKNRS